jgi:hypothetical protein
MCPHLGLLYGGRSQELLYALIDTIKWPGMYRLILAFNFFETLCPGVHLEFIDKVQSFSVAVVADSPQSTYRSIPLVDLTV